jgi:hypothetical protein
MSQLQPATDQSVVPGPIDPDVPIPPIDPDLPLPLPDPDQPPSIQAEHGVSIIIGEIPDAHDLSVMRWTARCTDASHDLLGYYDSRGEAEAAGQEHLDTVHRAVSNGV